MILKHFLMNTKSAFWPNFDIIGSCPLDGFRCHNETCVPYSRICDGNDDCPDNSDETEGCSGTFIMHYLI